MELCYLHFSFSLALHALVNLQLFSIFFGGSQIEFWGYYKYFIYVLLMSEIHGIVSLLVWWDIFSSYFAVAWFELQNQIFYLANPKFVILVANFEILIL